MLRPFARKTAMSLAIAIAMAGQTEAKPGQVAESGFSLEQLDCIPPGWGWIQRPGQSPLKAWVKRDRFWGVEISLLFLGNNRFLSAITPPGYAKSYFPSVKSFRQITVDGAEIEVESSRINPTNLLYTLNDSQVSLLRNAQQTIVFATDPGLEPMALNQEERRSLQAFLEAQLTDNSAIDSIEEWCSES